MIRTSEKAPGNQADSVAAPSGLKSEQFSIIRARSEHPEPGKVIEIPREDAYSVIVQLRDFASHKLWRGERLSYEGGHVQKSLAITHLGDELRCQHLAAFDNVRFNIPRAAMDAFTYEEGVRAASGFDCATGAVDPTVYHLACALAPALEMPGEVNRLFVDQVMLALCAHITSHYGHAQPPGRVTRGLSPWQVRRAKELIVSHLADGLSIAQLASECSLSRSHFTRAFKQSTGMSPHEWLLKMRVEKAKKLLLHSHLCLSQIGLDCGFADQSHFTRVFRRAEGTSPSNWRRFHQSRG